MTISFNNGSVGSCNNSGIKSLQINAAGHLICTYADNTIEDLGRVVGYNGENGTNFYPDEIGFDVPDGTYHPERPIGWSYLSLANNTSILYFKTSASDVTPVTWNKMEFGKGDKGDSGRPFTIDGSGSTKPITGLFDEFTFYDTTDGCIYIYDLDTTTWRGPFQFEGPKGSRGTFKIDAQGDTLPSITDLDYGYMFYDTSSGELYYVEENPNVSGQKQWSQPIPFRGEQGVKGDSIKGDTGDAGASIYIVKNLIDHSYNNTLLVIGEVPIGYVVTNIEVKVHEGYEENVNDMKVRFGGTVQDDETGVVIASYDMFDIKVPRTYIVSGVNHEPSTAKEILACVFNESVNNSTTGSMTVIVQMALELPVQPISNNI